MPDNSSGEGESSSGDLIASSDPTFGVGEGDNEKQNRIVHEIDIKSAGVQQPGSMDCDYHVLSAIDRFYGKGRDWREFKKMAGNPENGLTLKQVGKLLDKAGFNYERGTDYPDMIDGLRRGFVPIIFYNDRESGNAHANILRRFEQYNMGRKQFQIFDVVDPMPAPLRYNGFENFQYNFYPNSFIIKGYKP